MPGFHAADQVETAFDRVIDAVIEADPEVDRTELRHAVGAPKIAPIRHADSEITESSTKSILELFGVLGHPIPR